MGSAGSINGRHDEAPDTDSNASSDSEQDSEAEADAELARERKETLQRAAVVKLQPKPVDVTDAVANDEAEEAAAVANFSLREQVLRLWSRWDTTAASAAKIIGRAAWGTPGALAPPPRGVCGVCRVWPVPFHPTLHAARYSREHGAAPAARLATGVYTVISMGVLVRAGRAFSTRPL